MKKTYLILSFLCWGIGWFLAGYLFGKFIIHSNNIEQTHKPPVAISIAGSGNDGFHIVYENGK